MSIGAINQRYNYQNTYNNRTVYLPTPTCQPKIRDFGDECIISEKNDGDNDIYRSAYTNSSTCGTLKSYCSGVMDLSSLVTGTNENNRFIGSLSSDSDVDYLKLNTMSQFFNRKPVYITMSVPEGCDYKMSLYDKEGNQVGMSTDNGDGTKTIKVPCDWSNSIDYVLKIEKADGSEVKPDENYSLSFKQGEMPEDEKKALEENNKKTSNSSTDAKGKFEIWGFVAKEREKWNSEGMAKLHEEQFQALPKELQYTGEESAQSMLDRKANGEKLTDAEEAYISIYGNVNDIQKIETAQATQRFQDEFKSDLETMGISPDSSMNIEISSSGKVKVTGLSEEENAKVQKLVEEKYIQKIKNAYLSNSDKVADMSNEDYRVAGYVEELDRFLSKASGGNTRVDDLSIETKQGAYSTSSNYIAGLPGNVADLINNNSDAVSKYYDYKNMLYEVLTYKQHYGTVPRYNVQTSINQGTFGYM